MSKFGLVLPVLLAFIGHSSAATAEQPAFRPPAVPLVTVDPYTSVWSFSDNLYDSWPVHWTGAVQAMAGMIRIDGKCYRFMGPDAVCPETVEQTALAVRPTQTIYTFAKGGVAFTLTFTTPMLPDDAALLTSPVTYLDWSVRATDGKEHTVALYFDATAEWAINEADQRVVWERQTEAVPGVTLLRFSSEEQPVLAKDGDNIRIDWGHFYVAVPTDATTQSCITGHETARRAFSGGKALPSTDDTRMPRAANDDWPVIACTMDLGAVGTEPVTRTLTVAYDDLYSIEYMHEQLRPWWFKAHGSFNAMLQHGLNGHADILARCADFDEALLHDAADVGGDDYAALIGLSYRHVWASGKVVVGPDGDPWFFHKECFSNGCIATVDVSYPASPFFALFAPKILEGMSVMIFDYAASGAWPHPFAPHDVGRYPKANGQAYNATKIEGQMPVEECGNMLLMVAQAAKATGDTAFAGAHWDLITQWAEYLKEKGLDPENQLCTDDFTGHLAHNTNLSLKAINALGAYAMLCEMRGMTDEAAAYDAAARGMAKQWIAMAGDGDHYRLTFDKPGTWSLKYNLVWDQLLHLGLFPPEVARKEVAYYVANQNAYGIPLDPRADFTKSDWLVWAATMAEDQGGFETLVKPLYRFCDESPSRVPFSDWYFTSNAEVRGFRARPVIGGIFIKFLADEALWRKWRERAAAW